MIDDKEKEIIKERLKKMSEKEMLVFGKKEQKKSEKYTRPFSSFIRYTHLGLEFLFIFMVFFFFGRYLDTKLNSAPWLMFLFLMIGFAVGLYRIIKVAKELSE
ncbi:MAG: AtpZ/AtpI family protein [Spirochaetia bacterium]|nr:AtpZ/AtpI family protein [Spirochaetia bacterium]